MNLTVNTHEKINQLVAVARLGRLLGMNTKSEIRN